jgi:bacteriophage N4 adsorption protein A
MRVVVSVLAVLLVSPALAPAQTPDLAGDLTGYRRFVVYPHLKKGWESLQKGERERAITELERAHTLAPESATVALHLASAYRKFGDIARAESLLRQQLERTPDDARLRTALTELRAPSQPAAPNPAANPCASAADASCGKSAANGVRVAGNAPVATDVKNNAAAAGSVSTVTTKTNPPVRARQKVKPLVQPDSSLNAAAGARAELMSAFTLAIQTRRFDDALQQGESLAATDARNGALFDELSFKLVDAGGNQQAIRMLLRAYPFTTFTPAERETLFQRLALSLEQHRSVVPETDLSPLRAPLDTPPLRSRQATMWVGLKECDTVRTVLGDMSPEYGYDDWMRLGDCSTGTSPEIARAAYAKAHAAQPGGRGSRELAYGAYAAGDYRTALEAWRSIEPNALAADGALSAATTALAAGENEQAAKWLRGYRDHGNALDHRYWSLLGQSHAKSDPAAAIAAFEQAVELQPDVDDYLRLAQLDRPERQVQWLERAVKVDAANANLQLQLAYAYGRAGREESSLKALERAAALDPDNMNVQIELGYAHWRAGHAALAQIALERALQADPRNLVLTKQLVYIAQRLHQNETARWYAEQILDVPTAFSDDPTQKETGTAADQRFAMRRLHEDLGRRVTVSLDGFSGSSIGTAANSPQPGGRYSSYAQFEADIRLGSPAIRDGSTVSAFVRVLADGGVERRAMPSENRLLGVGLRWKPWRSQVIYFAAENQIGLEDADRRDVLLRASASFLNGARLGDDWHASGSGWFATNLYLDAAHFVRVEYSAFTADYRTSYHQKIASKNTLEPYAHIQFNTARNRQIYRDVRSGFGVRWNLWHGGTAYDADPHKLSIGVEYQQAFETYLPDRNGLFFTLGTRW